jgi:hypothetical protein
MTMIVWPTLYESSTSFGICVPVYSGSASAVPTSNVSTYRVQIDWDGDGDFSAATEDVTDDVKSISFSRGIDPERGTAITGTCQIRLHNAAGTYTPSLHATVTPGRLMQVSTTAGGTYTLFTGYLEEITPHPHPSTQDCYISAVDGMDYLARITAKVAFYDTRPFLGILADLQLSANWPWEGTNFQDLVAEGGIGTALLSYIDGGSVRSAFDRIAKALDGRCYIDRRGYLIFEPSTHRATYHATSEFTFSNTMVDISYVLNSRDVYNKITAEVKSIKSYGASELVYSDRTAYTLVSPSTHGYYVVMADKLYSSNGLSFNPMFTGAGASVISWRICST